MSDDGTEQGTRFRLKSWHLIVVAVVVLAGAIGVHVAVHRNEVEQRLKALRAAGYPTSFAELAEYNKLPEGARNAASVYEKAFAFVVLPADAARVPLLGQAQLPDRGEPLPEPMAQAIAATLAENQQCLALLREAAGIEHCRYDWDYTAAMQELKSVRQCAQLLRLTAVWQAHQGDTDAAIMHIKDSLRLSESLRREPAIISYLVRVACSALAVVQLEQVLNLATCTDRQLQDMDEALAATAGSLDLAEAMITERCINIEFTRNPSLLTGLGSGGAVLRLPGIRGRGLIDILDYMGKCVEAARLPLTERVARFRAIEAELDGLSFLHAMVKILAPAMSRVAQLDLRIHAHLDLARTALALERYRLATGAVPDRLDALVPQYLERVPIDPFDGKPIRYRRTDPGYLLYSVMEDGEDNGGLERSQAGRDQPCDLCFIVVR